MKNKASTIAEIGVETSSTGSKSLKKLPTSIHKISNEKMTMLKKNESAVFLKIFPLCLCFRGHLAGSTM